MYRRLLQNKKLLNIIYTYATEKSARKKSVTGCGDRSYGAGCGNRSHVPTGCENPRQPV